MVRKELGQQPGEPIGPATEQTPEELALAQEIRTEIDGLLGGQTSRSINFNVRRAREVLLKFHGATPFLESDKWPIPTWKPFSAELSKEGDKYKVEVEGHDDFSPDDIHYGIRFTLYGTYPRIDNIRPVVPHDRCIPIKSAEPAKDGRLRPRMNRLEFGKFLVDRIEYASSGVCILV